MRYAVTKVRALFISLLHLVLRRRLASAIVVIYTGFVFLVAYNIACRPPVRIGILPVVESFTFLDELSLRQIPTNERTVIAIGSGITSVGVANVTVSNIAEKFVFLWKLLPSFYLTASPGFNYAMYLAYDDNDKVFNDAKYSEAFTSAFVKVSRRLAVPTFNVSLKLIRCRHHGNPAWAQNDAMLEAYLDGAEYFHRINDDTVMQSPGWTEAYISALSGFSPPRVGAVGPVHSGAGEGEIDILTYDFVHRTHIDIFGFYYPREFGGWFGDTWITDVYMPRHAAKLRGIRVMHTDDMGTRYERRAELRKTVAAVVDRGQEILDRYVCVTCCVTGHLPILDFVASMSTPICLRHWHCISLFLTFLLVV